MSPFVLACAKFGLIAMFVGLGLRAGVAAYDALDALVGLVLRAVVALYRAPALALAVALVATCAFPIWELGLSGFALPAHLVGVGT